MFNNVKKENDQKTMSNTSNIIGKETSLDGSLNTLANLRIEGKVNGDIQTKAKIVLGETSVVEGGIIAQTAEIGGEVKGTIKVSGLLTLKATAVVNGEIIAGKLLFEAGARFDGKCSMGNSLEATKSTARIQNEDVPKPAIQQVALAKKGS
ncbi:MAG: bactofilin family protein [Bacteroidota bacterium]